MQQSIHSVETISDFVAKSPEYRRDQGTDPDALDPGTTITELFAGLSYYKQSDEISIGIAIHDGTYSIDFAVHKIRLQQGFEDNESSVIEEHIISNIIKYREKHLCKILGAGVSLELENASKICSRLWYELDIVPITFKASQIMDESIPPENVDELADSVARKCLIAFGPNKQPRIAISYRNEVNVDLFGQIRLTNMTEYEQTVRKPTWRAVQKYVKDIKDRKIRVAFFSATPQGGGVALMRHALLRFLRCMDVRVEWYVPTPWPDIFRITKTNHNILQGVVGPDVRATDKQLQKIDLWIRDNAKRFWLKDNGPLKPAAEGGADIIIVDDPQMPQLIPISKEQDQNRPVIFRSHIEIRDDLIKKDGSAAQHVWNHLWKDIQIADMFISHPVKSFVPSDVDIDKVGWMPATTDWLDGLNKSMKEWDIDYYLHTLRQKCQAQGIPILAYPKRPYITQIARFDPSKGIPVVIKSFAKLIDSMSDQPKDRIPQLVICGHASVDDPDGSKVYDEAMWIINHDFAQYKDDILVIRLGPSDQMLNAIMSMSKVALQLSSREGFEVKVSEALHKGKPIIASDIGGIPLQIEDGKSGYLVPPDDDEVVAKHLYNLFTDDELYNRMSSYAKDHVSDEVHTVGNALVWLYLISSAAEGKMVQPQGRWINDLAREAADEPYEEDEPRLPRDLST